MTSKPRKIKTKGKQLLSIPYATQEERQQADEFFRLFKRFRNRGFTIIRRGRGSRKHMPNKSIWDRARQQRNCPLDHADWIAVYARELPTDAENRIRQQETNLWFDAQDKAAMDRISRLEETNRTLHNDLAKAQHTILLTRTGLERAEEKIRRLQIAERVAQERISAMHKAEQRLLAALAGAQLRADES